MISTFLMSIVMFLITAQKWKTINKTLIKCLLSIKHSFMWLPALMIYISIKVRK